MTVTQVTIKAGQPKIISSMKANFDEIVRVVENGY